MKTRMPEPGDNGHMTSHGAACQCYRCRRAAARREIPPGCGCAWQWQDGRFVRVLPTRPCARDGVHAQEPAHALGELQTYTQGGHLPLFGEPGHIQPG